MNLLKELSDEFSKTRYATKGLEKLLSIRNLTKEEMLFLAKVVEYDNIKDTLFRMNRIKRDVTISIGNNLPYKEMKNMAIFESAYYYKNEPMGKILSITYKFTDFERAYLAIKEYSTRLSEIISQNL